MSKPTTITEYIRNAPDAHARKALQAVRAHIKKLVPQATEKLAWDMPTFYLEGNLIHFAAFTKHYSLFPGSEAIAAFKKEAEARGFQTSKGTIQIPYECALPTALLTKIVKFCVKRNLASVAAKKAKLAAKKKKKKPAVPRKVPR